MVKPKPAKHRYYHQLPGRFTTFRHGGRPYHYCHGRVYQRHTQGFVIVTGIPVPQVVIAQQRVVKPRPAIVSQRRVPAPAPVVVVQPKRQVVMTPAPKPALKPKPKVVVASEPQPNRRGKNIQMNRLQDEVAVITRR